MRAKQLGVNFQIHFVDTPKEVLWARLSARNAQHPEKAFFIPETKLEEWLLLFEPPTEEEIERGYADEN